MGLEFREAALLLNAKCEASVKPGMVFNVAVGLADLEAKDVPDASSRKYALFLSDTVLVSEAGANEVITAELVAGLAAWLRGEPSPPVAR